MGLMAAMLLVVVGVQVVQAVFIDRLLTKVKALEDRARIHQDLWEKQVAINGLVGDGLEAQSRQDGGWFGRN